MELNIKTLYAETFDLLVKQNQSNTAKPLIQIYTTPLKNQYSNVLYFAIYENQNAVLRALTL